MSEPVPVLARDMKQLGAWAQWTRREGYCTVQIILETATTPDRRPAVASANATPAAKPKPPATQVWLLRADGTAMSAQRTTVELPKSIRERTTTYTYAFPESASREAAAVAVMIDGKYFIEKLEPFPDVK